MTKKEIEQKRAYQFLLHLIVIIVHCRKIAKIKLDKQFNSNLFEALKSVTLPKGIGIELNCAYFSLNKDAFKIRIKENGDVECLGLNKED